MRLGSELDLENIITEMFWEWFDDEFKHQNPDNTSHYDYDKLFKMFWDDLYWDMWKPIEKQCYDRHCDIYEYEYDFGSDDNDDIDGCYERENGI